MKLVLKVLMSGVGIALVAAVVLIMYNEHFVGFYILYGAAGVGFFLVATKLLSVIQKEGRQDD